MKESRVRHADFRQLLGLDLIGFGLTWTPGALALALAVKASSCFPLGWAVFSLPFIAGASFIGVIGLFRSLLPRLRTGIFQPGFNRGFIAWYCHLSLARSASVFGIRPLLQSTYLTRYLYWRAMGAKVAFGVHSSFTVDLADAPLVRIGENTTLADHARVSAHTFVGDKVYLAPVEIGSGCFVGAGASIGPKTQIEDGCWVEPGQNLLRKKITSQKAAS
jgi:hypothetical protein